MDRHLDVVAVTGERLVDGVVDDLVDEMVKSADTGRADVHAGALANRLETLEDGDVVGAVAVFGAVFPRRLRVVCHSFLPVRVSVDDAAPGGGVSVAKSPDRAGLHGVERARRQGAPVG